MLGKNVAYFNMQISFIHSFDWKLVTKMHPLYLHGFTAVSMGTTIFFGIFALCIQFRSPKPLYQSTTKSESNVIILRVNVKKRQKKVQCVITFCLLGSHFAALTCALSFLLAFGHFGLHLAILYNRHFGLCLAVFVCIWSFQFVLGCFS